MAEGLPVGPPLPKAKSLVPSDLHSSRPGRHRLRALLPAGAVELPSPKVQRKESVPVEHHLKQAGVVLQQQFRGLRRRVQSARAQHTLRLRDSSVPSSTKAAMVSPSREEEEEGDFRPFQLTPKKVPSHSPIPNQTIKIQLPHERDAPAESFPEAVCLWIDACHQLMTAPVTHRLLTRTGAVYFHGASLCFRTVTLPITLPIHVGCTAVHTVTSVVGGIVSTTTAVIAAPLLQQSSGQGSEEQHDWGLLGSLFSLPGTVLSITGHVAASVLAPVLGIPSSRVQEDCHSHENCTQSTGASSSPEKQVVYDATASPGVPHDTSTDFLDRLRLDYVCPKDKMDDEKTVPRKLFSEAKEAVCPFLLRVNDWNVARPTDDSNIYYMDISPTALEHPRSLELVALAMDQFVRGAMALLSSHPICRITATAEDILPSQRIRWHPEGATKRLLQQESDADLEHVLIWSGRFQQEEGGYGRKHGFFLARGCIPMSPERFVKLLWDNTRTSEYNNFCLGRFTLHGLSRDWDDDRDFLSGATTTASKVIQSEMRVPFAGITVKAVCLMHVRPLPDGFVICSRTLDTGPAGLHTAPRETVVPAQNEILWGVNVLRAVPGSQTTQWTSLSQVGATGVPSFLAQKIGLMGIAEFFKNVRHVAEQPQRNIK